MPLHPFVVAHHPSVVARAHYNRYKTLLMHDLFRRTLKQLQQSGGILRKNDFIGFASFGGVPEDFRLQLRLDKDLGRLWEELENQQN